MKTILRFLRNIFHTVPTTFRKPRTPSSRFATLEARAAAHGDSLKRHGRNYNLITSDMRVLEFDNLAQVKSHMDGPVPDVVHSGFNETDSCDCGPTRQHPEGGIYKIGALSPAVAQGDTYDIGSPPTRLGDPNFMNQEGNLKPGPATDVGSSGKFVPFVPVVVTPITNDKVRE